jgi:acetyl-CoA/propionyl-CoA carboxylase biotin carboxyl carrier protein
VLTPELRASMGAASVALARSVGYVGAGTLEFLFQGGQFYFLEMNTRIQVEHTVTEMVTGVDLVQAQLRIAMGERLWLSQSQISLRGHAIECRINAEDPAHGFRPSLGTLSEYVEPTGYGVRIDSGVRPGYTIPQYYDSMIAKLVTWGADRAEAIGRMRRALADYRVAGMATTIPFHSMALAHPAFVAGDATVNFIPRYLADRLNQLASAHHGVAGEPIAVAEFARTFQVEVNGRRFDVRVAEPGAEVSAPATNGKRPPARRAALAGHKPAAADGVLSSIQGAILAVKVVPGQVVEAGQLLFLIEAMKMENEITAPHAGTISAVRVQIGQVVEAGSVLATYAAAG